MNGAGNDFVVLDNRENQLDLTRAQIAQLCDRQRGVGADGLLAVEPATASADFRMRYYNADGGEAEMCGNGARCFARFAQFLIGTKKESLSFETPAGLISATFHGEAVRIKMSAPHDLRMHLTAEADGGTHALHFINTGVPHIVVPVSQLGEVRVIPLGSALRYHADFQPRGANVNFMEVRPGGGIAIRTYERGVEGETLACGTGMVACAIIHSRLTGSAGPVAVTVRGGDTLSIGFTPEGDAYTDVTLTGPADMVYSGQIAL